MNDDTAQPMGERKVQIDAPHGPTLAFTPVRFDNLPTGTPEVKLRFSIADDSNGIMRFEWTSPMNPDEARQLVEAVTDTTREAIAEVRTRNAQALPGAGQPSDPDALAQVRAAWDLVLVRVEETSKQAAVVLRETAVVDARPPLLLLGLRHAALAALLQASPGLVERTLADVTGREWQIQVGPLWPGDWQHPLPKPTEEQREEWRRFDEEAKGEAARTDGSGAEPVEPVDDGLPNPPPEGWPESLGEARRRTMGESEES